MDFRKWLCELKTTISFPDNFCFSPCHTASHCVMTNTSSDSTAAAKKQQTKQNKTNERVRQVAASLSLRSHWVYNIKYLWFHICSCCLSSSPKSPFSSYRFRPTVQVQIDSPFDCGWCASLFYWLFDTYVRMGLYKGLAWLILNSELSEGVYQFSEKGLFFRFKCDSALLPEKKQKKNPWPWPTHEIPAPTCW